MTGLPTFMQGYTSRNLASTALTSIGSGAPPTLSIEGGRFTIIDATGQNEIVGAMDPKIGLYVDLVIVDLLERKSKIYYGAKYDASNPTPPQCWSDNGIAPSTQAGNPQAPTCASCPQNVIGSATGMKGQGVRACHDQIKAAIVLPQYPDEVFLLKIPPNSFKHFRVHSQWFEKNQTPMETVVTRVYFEQGVVGTLMFHALNYIQDETLFFNIRQMLEGKQTDSLVGRTDVPRQIGYATTGQLQVTGPAISPPTQVIPPVAQPAGFVSGMAAPQPTQMAPAPAQAPAEPARRRRRSSAEVGIPAAQAAPQQAPFQQAQPVPQPGNGAAFGMQAGVPPNADLVNTLNSIFPQK